MKLYHVHGEKRRWFTNPEWIARTFCGLTVDVYTNRQRLSESPTPVTCKTCKRAMKERGTSMSDHLGESQYMNFSFPKEQRA
jgi:hypothetical protein